VSAREPRPRGERGRDTRPNRHACGQQRPRQHANTPTRQHAYTPTRPRSSPRIPARPRARSARRAATAPRQRAPPPPHRTAPSANHRCRCASQAALGAFAASRTVKVHRAALAQSPVEDRRGRSGQLPAAREERRTTTEVRRPGDVPGARAPGTSAPRPGYRCPKAPVFGAPFGAPRGQPPVAVPDAHPARPPARPRFPAPNRQRRSGCPDGPIARSVPNAPGPTRRHLSRLAEADARVCRTPAGPVRRHRSGVPVRQILGAVPEMPPRATPSPFATAPGTPNPPPPMPAHLPPCPPSPRGALAPPRPPGPADRSPPSRDSPHHRCIPPPCHPPPTLPYSRPFEPTRGSCGEVGLGSRAAVLQQ